MHEFTHLAGVTYTFYTTYTEQVARQNSQQYMGLLYD